MSDKEKKNSEEDFSSKMGTLAMINTMLSNNGIDYRFIDFEKRLSAVEGKLSILERMV